MISDVCQESSNDNGMVAVVEAAEAALNGTDTHELLANLKLRMEQLEKHCHFEHSSRRQPSIQCLTDDSVASTVSMSYSGECEESSMNSSSELPETGDSGEVEPSVSETKQPAQQAIASLPTNAASEATSHPPPSVAPAEAAVAPAPSSSTPTSKTMSAIEARKERLAKLRQVKRNAEQIGTRKLQTSQTLFDSLLQEKEQLKKQTEELKAQQVAWEEERTNYRQALKDMKVLVKSLQQALCNPSSMSSEPKTPDDSAFAAEKREQNQAPSQESTSTSDGSSTEQAEKKAGDETDDEVDLSPESALEMTLTNTKQVIEQLDEERQRMAVYSDHRKYQNQCLESVIQTQQHTIEELKEENFLQKVKIDSLQDMVVQSLQLLQEEADEADGEDDQEENSTSKDKTTFEFVPGTAAAASKRNRRRHRIAQQAQLARALLQKTGQQIHKTNGRIGERLQKTGQQIQRTSDGIGKQVQKTSGNIKKTLEPNSRGKRVLQASRNLWAMASSAAANTNKR